jgi:hypothetical protein
MPEDEKDQTGEVTQEKDGPEGEEFDADAHDLLLDDGEEDGKAEKEPSEEKEGEKEKGEKEPDELTKVKTELERQASHIKNLNKALHEARQDRKKGKDEGGKEEAPLTKEQLLAIMKEHKEDEGVLLNVIQYAAEQAAKGAEKKAVDAVEISSKKKEIDDYLGQNYPKLSDAESEDRVSVDKVKDMLSVADHPFGDFMAVAVRTQLMLPSILQAAVEQGKKEALGENADKSRKANAKANAPAPSGKSVGVVKGKAGLSGDSADVAKRIGLSVKGQAIYSKLLKGSNKSVSVED